MFHRLSTCAQVDHFEVVVVYLPVTNLMVHLEKLFEFGHLLRWIEKISLNIEDLVLDHVHLSSTIMLCMMTRLVVSSHNCALSHVLAREQ
jgi:hypothetical protein